MRCKIYQNANVDTETLYNFEKILTDFLIDIMTKFKSIDILIRGNASFLV